MVSCLLAALALASGPTHCDPAYLTILDQPEHFSVEYTPRPPGAARQLAWGIVLRTLDTPVDELRRTVESALDTTGRTGYPLLIHLDDWNFAPPSTDPDWVEWTAFPRPGERHGLLVKRRWLNWGSWIVTGPPPDYESPKFRGFMRRQIVDGVLKPLVPRLRKWRREGRAQLFAGLVVGWESGYYTMPKPAVRPVAGKETFQDDEVVATGYAALWHRGWNTERLAREARRRGVTGAALFRELMTGVVHDYTAYLCSICARGGVPRDRIYTHFTAYATVADRATIGGDGRLLPLSTAVNRWSRPGFTMTRPWADYDKVAQAMHKAGRKDWGAVEMEITPQRREESQVLEDLESLSSRGAKLLCLYGWWEQEGHMFAIRGTGAVPAIRKWLNEGDPTAAIPADRE